MKINQGHEPQSKLLYIITSVAFRLKRNSTYQYPRTQLRKLLLQNNIIFLIPLFTVFLFTGCAALVVGGAAIGAGTGTFFYVDGELRTDYYAPFDKVWNACERTVADKRGTGVVPVREIAQGKIHALINDQKVYINVKYKSKDFTTVSIRVGFMGNKLASQLLHDNIADNLAKY